MKAIPDSAYAFVRALDRPATFDFPQLFTIGVPEKMELFHNLLLLQIPDADGFHPAIYVVTTKHRVRVGPRGDMDLDLRVRMGKGGKEWRLK